MAIEVTNQTQVISTTVADRTLVKSIMLGTPMTSLNVSGASTFSGLFDVDVDSNLTDGDLIQYVLSSNTFRNVDLRAEIDSSDNALQIQITANDSDITSVNSTIDDLRNDIDSNALDLINIRNGTDIDSNAITSTKLASFVTLNIRDSDGSILKTLYGAGS